ncbi:hypothetical protein C8J56DRAFT_1059477 [Mycena floridula]|nr:hypothetical protein C8J56DRAFT_1059477 [Mycena floridula]
MPSGIVGHCVMHPLAKMYSIKALLEALFRAEFSRGLDVSPSPRALRFTSPRAGCFITSSAGFKHRAVDEQASATHLQGSVVIQSSFVPWMFNVRFGVVYEWSLVSFSIQTLKHVIACSETLNPAELSCTLDALHQVRKRLKILLAFSWESACADVSRALGWMSPSSMRETLKRLLASLRSLNPAEISCTRNLL